MTASATLRFHPTRILQSLRASYWFVPTCMVPLAIGLALLVPWVDSRYDVDLSGRSDWIGQTQAGGAREVLGAIAGSNFGPRMVGDFMRDRGNQVTLGTFIATFVYCLPVLRRVHGAADSDASASYDAFVPHLSVLVAPGLALASVGVLIRFIRHVPGTIDVDRLVAGIGRDLRRRVPELFPHLDRGSSDAPGRSWRERVEGRAGTSVTLDGSGFVQALELGNVEFMRCDDNLALPDANDPVQVRPIDFERFTSTIFDQTRQYVCSDRNVSLHVLDVLVEAAVRATRAEHLGALVRGPGMSAVPA